MLTTIVPALLALICGAVLTTQVGSNTLLGKSLNNAYIPAAANMVTGLVFTILLLLIVQKPVPSVEQVRAAQWWTWLAGGFLVAAYHGKHPSRTEVGRRRPGRTGSDRPIAVRRSGG